MIHVLQEIFEKTLARLVQQLTTFLPPLIVAVTMIAVAFLLASIIRYLILKVVKGAALDRFLRESGLFAGRFRGAALVAGACFWAILVFGVLTALDVFDTTLTTRIVEATVFSVPKLIAAGAILLAGFWLAQYLSRSTLIWAVNEEIAQARRLAAAVRIVILFLAVVVAADALQFASQVFFAAFVMLMGAAALAVGIAAGFSLRNSFDRYLKPDRPEPERSLWNHL